MRGPSEPHARANYPLRMTAGFVRARSAIAEGERRADRRAPLHQAARFRPAVTFRCVAYTALLIGVVLRLAQYAANRSLAIDETLLSINIMSRSFRGLLETLNYTQAAPIGFLETQKAITEFFGDSEYAFRLFPLIASILALGLMFRVTSTLLNGPTALLALVFFALLDPLIAYGSTAKPYGIDVAAVLLLYVAYLSVPEIPTSRDLLRVGAAGILAVWFSFPAAVVLAIIGVLIGLRVVLRRSWSCARLLALICGTWVISFTIDFLLERPSLLRVRGAFESDPSSFDAIHLHSGTSEFLDEVTARFRFFFGLEDMATGEPVFPEILHLPNSVNIGVTVAVGLLAVIGLLFALVRRPDVGVLLAGPAGLILLAGQLHLYPLVSRTLLFLMPAVALCIGFGAKVVLSLRPRMLRGLVSTVMLVPTLVAVATLSSFHLVHPRSNEEMKSVLQLLDRRQRSGDSLYVYYGAQYAIRYYSDCGCSGTPLQSRWRIKTAPLETGRWPPAIRSNPPRVVVGSQVYLTDEQVRRDLGQLRGRPRVWLVFAEIRPELRARALRAIDNLGRRIDSFDAAGPPDSHASLFLYDLRARRSYLNRNDVAGSTRPGPSGELRRASCCGN